MRLTLTAIALILLPSITAAQSATPALPALPPIGLPLPSITTPLPPIGLPLPPIGLGPSIDARDRHVRQPSQGPGHDDRRTDPRRGARSRPAIIYVVPAYGWSIYQTTMAMPQAGGPFAPSPTAVDGRGIGIFRLELDSGAAAGVQLYVDGYFVGSPEDFHGELALDAGPHAIEIRAAGYETIAFNAKIVAGQSMTYRGALQPTTAKIDTAPAAPTSTATAPVTPAAPAPPSTFYFIPGCYIGNVPPQSVVLPVSCDLTRLVTRTR